ncbi:hypothetical protein CF165_28330 [Amycolatopsis vastitatis]|uniref:Uncharacterized protein n=1 Tax=Amycolatopsis vastitatis TaxID=1905142 RepID=A0A229SZW5_9PSEU|nr:hypothetical protein CF165_28330 [Amycolatopsis vastitatis]
MPVTEAFASPPSSRPAKTVTSPEAVNGFGSGSSFAANVRSRPRLPPWRTASMPSPDSSGTVGISRPRATMPTPLTISASVKSSGLNTGETGRPVSALPAEHTARLGSGRDDVPAPPCRAPSGRLPQPIRPAPVRGLP